MQDHMPRHQDKMIYADHWPTYFKNLKEKYTGKRIRLEGSGNIQTNPEPKTILTHIDYKPTHEHHLLMLATRGQEISHEVNLVWSIEDQEGQVMAFEVIDPHDQKLKVYFTE